MLDDTQLEVKTRRARALLVQMGRLKENCREAKRNHKAEMQDAAKRYDNFRQERDRILSELAEDLELKKGAIV